MEKLKKIIREGIIDALKVLSEQEVALNNPTDSIIYNYELGREFANNTLQVDINNLNTYYLSEYLPKSVNQEKWNFEFQTTIGSALMVDITRSIRGGKSFWTMIFGVINPGDDIPTIKDMIEDVEGYDNFISIVNSGIAKRIDSSKY